MLHKAELLKTIEHIRGLPPEQFNMGTFWRQDEKCGTRGCIIGWYCHLHPKAALKLQFVRDDLLCLVGYPKFRAKTNVEALCAYFDLTYKEVSKYFYSQADGYCIRGQDCLKSLERRIARG